MIWCFFGIWSKPRLEIADTYIRVHVFYVSRDKGVKNKKHCLNNRFDDNGRNFLAFLFLFKQTFHIVRRSRYSCMYLDALCFYGDVCIGYVSGGVLQVLYVTSSVKASEQKSKKKKKQLLSDINFSRCNGGCETPLNWTFHCCRNPVITRRVTDGK